MKKVVVTLIATLFAIVGCQESNSILEPENEQFDASTLNKGRIIIDRNLDDGDDDKDLKDLFFLDDSVTYGKQDKLDDDYKEYDDERDDYSFESLNTLTYTEKFVVNGNKGGKISVTHSWKDENGRKINLNAALVIPKNAYKGDLTFAMIFDLENYGVELYPSPFTFDKPVALNLLFSGVDLSKINPETFVFDYLDGAPENLKYDYIEVDVANNVLEVVSAQIPHFSRYGWVRTK